jgi:hypothetical protein
MPAIRETVRKAVERYAVKGINSDAYLTVRPDGHLLTVIDFASDHKGQRFVATSLVVRFAADLVIIQHDDNNKPLVDALAQAGIPRTQIVLAYAGEAEPALR